MELNIGDVCNCIQHFGKIFFVGGCCIYSILTGIWRRNFPSESVHEVHYCRYKAPMTPLSLLAFCFTPGNVFDCEVVTWQQISQIFSSSQDATSSLVTLPALGIFMINLRSIASLPLSLVCSRCFSGQPVLTLNVVRPQSPKGRGVLNK